MCEQLEELKQERQKLTNFKTQELYRNKLSNFVEKQIRVAQIQAVKKHRRQKKEFNEVSKVKQLFESNLKIKSIALKI